jgi:hypothetical protein
MKNILVIILLFGLIGCSRPPMTKEQAIKLQQACINEKMEPITYFNNYGEPSAIMCTTTKYKEEK